MDPVDCICIAHNDFVVFFSFLKKGKKRKFEPVKKDVVKREKTKKIVEVNNNVGLFVKGIKKLFKKKERVVSNKKNKNPTIKKKAFAHKSNVVEEKRDGVAVRIVGREKARLEKIKR